MKPPQVDDLVVNERPNNHYVKKDDEQTPDLIKCYALLKDVTCRCMPLHAVTYRYIPLPTVTYRHRCYALLKDGWSEEVEAAPPAGVAQVKPPHMKPPHMKPPHLNPPHMKPPHMKPPPLATAPHETAGVAQDVWIRACSIVRYCEAHISEGVNYRLVKNAEGETEVVMLDDKGNVPKVPLAAPWLQYMSYKLSGKEPQAQSRYACVCTPYIFNKYAGIFGLTGSVGGKEELKYLTDTYSAVKFDVRRLLDTCRHTCPFHGRHMSVTRP